MQLCGSPSPERPNSDSLVPEEGLAWRRREAKVWLGGSQARASFPVGATRRGGRLDPQGARGNGHDQRPSLARHPRGPAVGGNCRWQEEVENYNTSES